MTQAEILASLPAALHKHLDPAGPMPPRMMAAKGLAPLPPRDMVAVLAGLSLDTDAALAEPAKASLAKMPDKLLLPAIEGGLPAPVLGVLATALVGREELLEKIAVNRATPDLALAALAQHASAKIVEILAENQERCMRCEPLVRALRENTALLRSSLDRLFDFLVRAGVIYDDMPEFADSLARLSPAEMMAAADKVVLPEGVLALLQEDAAAPPVSSASAAIAAVAAEAQEAAAEDDEEAEEAAQKKLPMLKQINAMNAAQKVALAMKGNKEARAILLRDANRMVATATIKNPRITEQEIQGAAKSRSINDEVLRIICNSKEMTRSYGVKVALVSNPKTPLQIALRLLGLMRPNDLKSLAKSKSVSNAISTAAKKMVLSKTAGSS